MAETIAHSLFSEFDIYLFKSGKHFNLYEKLGAHLIEVEGISGAYFAVYAPAAKRVAVTGDFNDWDQNANPLQVRWDASGIWEGFIPNVLPGQAYKYHILSFHDHYTREKADPFARYAETPPRTASIVWEGNYKWKDKKWMKSRKAKNGLEAPMSIYEMHLGSWRWHEAEERPYTYQELAMELPEYLSEMGFTHVELMPVMEHPYTPSWGYQGTGFFAPTSRFGRVEDFQHLVDKLHQAGIGVILDWVPSHFPSDAHGLADFDGSNVYEHPDPRKGYHPDWDSLIFNYERNEVRSFLISSALFWLDQFHIDGLRVDAVASMLYLDYSRDEGGWEPNIHGGRENLAAISFLKDFNEAVYANFPDVQTIAEESTAFPMVSKPTFSGGLGFGLKWMMGWMNDTLGYFSRPPIYRKYHHHELTFSMVYAFTENYVLPFSHDEVVHGKASLLNKMPGDSWQQFANLRILLSYMYTHPGAKLLFMGAELAQRVEWRFAAPLDWHLLEFESHKGIQTLIKELNSLYREEPALHALNYSYEGFEWMDISDAEQSVVSYFRKSNNEKDTLLVVLNLTPSGHNNYKIGLPVGGYWKEIFNSDDSKYWGTGCLNKKRLRAKKTPYHGRDYTIELVLPPLGVTILKK